MPAKSKVAPKFAVGDKVIVFTDRTHTYRRDSIADERTVTKVGREYVYVGEGWNERKFLMENGREQVKWGDSARIFTLEGWADYQERQQALDIIRKAGMRFENWYDSDEKFTTLQLQRIAAILQEEH